MCPWSWAAGEEILPRRKKMVRLGEKEDLAGWALEACWEDSEAVGLCH